MSKGLLAIIVIGVSLLVGGIFIVASSDNNTSSSSSRANQASTEDPSSSDLTANSNRYTTLDGTDLSTIAADKRVLFFHASWCPTCRTLDRDIRAQTALIPEDVRIINVDFDEEAELRKKYGVTLQHTLVQIDENEDEISQWSGSSNLQVLLEQIQ